MEQNTEQKLSLGTSLKYKWNVWYHHEKDNWKISGYKQIYQIKSVEDFCLDWLRERFENANKYTNKGQTFYLDKNNDGGVSILHYYEDDVQDKSCYISYNKIWGFLKDTLALEDSQIRSILSKWLLEKFGLNLEPKKW